MDREAEDLARVCARIADERKAEDVVVMDVSSLAYFTDYFVLATGRNERQLRAIAEQIRSRAREMGCHTVGVEGEADSGWILIDLASVVVHLFNPDARELYDLELLWGAAAKIEWQEAEVPGENVGQ